MAELVGTGEAAAILGVSKQRIHQLAQGPDFPKPLARLAMGPVYDGAKVRAFAAKRSTKPGRRRSKDPKVIKRAERCACDHEKRSHRYESGFYDVRGGHKGCEVVGCTCESFNLANRGSS